jgi:hypothetical protein
VTEVGVGLTLVGVVVALWQLRRTKRAAEATRDALTRHVRRSEDRDLISQLAVLDEVEKRAVSAIRNLDVDSLYDALRAWGRAANLVRRYLLQSTSADEKAFGDLLMASILLTDRAKTDLIAPPRDAEILFRITTTALDQMAVCTRGSGPILSSHVIQPEAT